MKITPEHKVPVWLNPLIYFGAEFRPDGLVAEEVTYASMAGFLCRPGIGSQVFDLVRRYNEVSVERNRLPVAPGETALLDRLVWPLRDAKASYVIGSYLGTIALCGMVGEMAAILAFNMHNEAQDPVRYQAQQQRHLFGREFEKLGQERRVNILISLGVISAANHDRLEGIRIRRNRYLHDWSKDHSDIRDDALASYDASIDVVVEVLGLTFVDGKMYFREEVFAYLRKQGVATPWAPPDALLGPEGSDMIDGGDAVDPTS